MSNSLELLSADSGRFSLSPTQISAMGAAAVEDVKPLLRQMQVGVVSLLVAGPALMPVRSGYVWAPAAEAFQHDPFLRQVRRV